jgi:hypothetical protein
MTQRVLVQVTNVNYAGVTMYAWKLPGAIDPLPAEIVWTADPAEQPSGYEAYRMYESFEGTRGSAGKGRWAQCYVCRGDYPIQEMVLANGHYYCTANKCNEDLL